MRQTSRYLPILAVLVLVGCYPAHGEAPRYGQPGDGGASEPAPGWGGVWRDSSLSADHEAWLGGPLSGTPPAVTYPLTGAVIPPNLLPPVVHWTRRDLSHETFWLRLESDSGHFWGLGTCQVEYCSFPVPYDIWQAIPPGTDLTLTIQDAGPRGQTTSLAIRLATAGEPAGGGITFFVPARRGLMRAMIDGSAWVPYWTPKTSAADDCVGCHSVTRSGSHIVTTRESGLVVPADGDAPDVLPPATPAPIGTMGSWNKDGSRLFVTTNDYPYGILRRTFDWKVLALLEQPSDPKDGKFVQATLAPDGNHLALVVVPQDAPGRSDDRESWSGDIATIEFSDQDARYDLPWLDSHFVARAPKDEFYCRPSWSPDSMWIAFDAVRRGESSYYGRDVGLRLVSAAGGTVIRLDNATAGGPARHPSWSPDGKWLLFARHAPVPDSPDESAWQLWASRIDLTVMAGVDPTRAPFWLSQQGLEVSYWGSWSSALVCGPAAPCP